MPRKPSQTLEQFNPELADELEELHGSVVDKRQAPSYSYVGRKTRWERVHRSTYTKQRFINDPDLMYQSGHTEHEAALANKLYRIYDAGKTHWIKTVAR